MRRVLVVEDYPPLAKVLAIGLRRVGTDVERAGSCARARLAEGPFDVALLDVDLPDGNGVALAQELLETERVRAVVFFTATREPLALAAARSLGVCVSKQDGVEMAIAAVMSAHEASPMVAKVVGLPDAPVPRDSGRSGTRRRVR